MSEQFWPVAANAVILFALTALAPIFGYGCGRYIKARRPVQEDRGQLATIQGSILGLLALVLGFSFASAGTRFIDRQDMIVRESNAIGTAYLRADLIDEPLRTHYRDLLRQYTASRIKLLQNLDPKTIPLIIRESTEYHPRMWRIAVEGVKKNARHDVTVLNPLNEVIDLHSTHLAVMRRHLPPLVVILLIVISAVSLAIVGYGNGLAGQPNITLTSALTFLIFAVLWTTIDLDYPRLGLLRIGHQPLTELHESMK